MFCFYRNRVWMDADTGTGGGAADVAAAVEPPAEAGAPADAPPAETAPETAAAPEGADPAEGTLTPEMEALLSRMVDQKTHELGNKVKRLEAQNKAKDEKLTEKMSAEEIRQMELDQQAADLAEQKAAFEQKERQSYAMEAVVKAGFTGELALRARDIVMVGADNKAIQAHTVALKQFVDDAAAADVEERFRNGGRIPPKGGGGTAKKPSEMNYAELCAYLEANPGAKI